MRTIVITQFFLIKLVLSEVVESTVKECEVDECVSQDSCPYFSAVVDDLEELGLDTEEYKDMLGIVKESVCNREEKGVCCEDFENAIGTRSIIPRGRSCCRFRSIPFCQSLVQKVSIPSSHKGAILTSFLHPYPETHLMKGQSLL